MALAKFVNVEDRIGFYCLLALVSAWVLCDICIYYYCSALIRVTVWTHVGYFVMCICEYIGMSMGMKRPWQVGSRQTERINLINHQ